ncbi:MAG: hypothetical protein QMD23_08195 [Candidatus Bathyarchaeia archaeon]|nr:hypothetical protein [Candidatus Bathyarchaeia archaeon]
MNKKIFALNLIILSMLLCISLVNAATPEPLEVTAWTNKQEYAPGEKGTIYVSFYNNRNEAVAIKNVTLTYDAWRAYIGGVWVGNETYTMDEPLSGKKTKLLNEVVEITFTVPTDGRAVDTNVAVEVGTDKGFEYGETTIHIIKTSRYMEQIVTLFTIQAVLLIVCTVIIAATIFLSARRPQVMWKAEEKGE